tara:strand:- start:173 stop:427 length:255 start_codon:yes stop_codon:yes gene_type:complete
MNKEPDRADLELQLINWNKKYKAKYAELMENYGDNPVRDMRLENECDEMLAEILDIENLLKQITIIPPQKIRRFGCTYLLEVNK